MYHRVTAIVGFLIFAGMIEHVKTRRIIMTEVRPVEPDDFRRLGHSQRMILTTGAAVTLIEQYGGRPAHE
jgi:hypothetical protein